ncbi:LysE family translocator [Aeromonas rivipollensis]|jgi:threonine/homoserine/homoserine lactone efflux protein|uniref:LysE family translocator n=1 Tax=Aeromonas rivipollensis TaxID=948519 RepID=A0AAW9YC01_9GAMM|nr:LysE family translocator [Aeromonas rivipollensis]MDM5084671.1 LysE family translocator [Aeromonas rivipollensis]MDM5096742.1 LysE family translocator [Aeromonas rivipollensis]MDM5105031.1 LysE family translocator [Aeromonas rivipollensis]NEX75765.1 LysE family translocator [Aeromonas rivipollensis]NEX89361.1 LysE family translocator [Aeromonas rivipollensis]
MEMTSWLALAAICVMGAISPGPSLALIIRNTVQGGQGHGVATALGHGLGVGIYALITALGLSVLITQTPLLFDLIRYGGAAFLAWLGIKALLAKPASGDSADETVHGARGRQGAFEGFMVAFLNPQLAIFFIALFSQFVHADTGWREGSIMMLTAGGIDALWYVLVALVLSRGPVLAWLKAKSFVIDKISGLVLLGLALKVVI